MQFLNNSRFTGIYQCFCLNPSVEERSQPCSPLILAATAVDLMRKGDRSLVKYAGLLLVSLGVWGTGAIAQAASESTRLSNTEATAQFAVPTNSSSIVSQGVSQPILISQSSDGLLRFGDFGSEVEVIQQQLSELGYYDGIIDGDFGSGTENAVITFQQDYGLSADGVVGYETRVALENASSGTDNPGSDNSSGNSSDDGVLQLGDTGPAVTELQRRLRQVDAYDGDISGSFGSRTEEAVRLFQEREGLTVDGVVGPVTDAALTEAIRRQSTSGNPPNNGPSQPGSSPSNPSNNSAGTGSSRYSVVDLQRRLSRRGFYQGSLDGILGTETRDSITEAQDAYGVTEGDVLAPTGF